MVSRLHQQETGALVPQGSSSSQRSKRCCARCAASFEAIVSIEALAQAREEASQDTNLWQMNIVGCVNRLLARISSRPYIPGPFFSTFWNQTLCRATVCSKMLIAMLSNVALNVIENRSKKHLVKSVRLFIVSLICLPFDVCNLSKTV
jgi:hypothetical protein